jgi:hypothetical protein
MIMNKFVETVTRTAPGLDSAGDWKLNGLAMKRLPMIVMLGLGAVLTGCSSTSNSSQVKFTDVRPGPAATITDDHIQIVFGNDIAAPTCWIHPDTRTEGGTVYVYGYHNPDWATHECLVKVPSLVNSQDVKVVWINPDGSHVPVPMTP